jgi:hypothetical protein
MLGCAEHDTMQVLSPGSMELAAAPLGDVKVALAPTLPESRRTAFTEHDGEAVVRQAIVDAFTQRSHWDPSSSQVLHVTVTRFRLRSTANAVVNGIYAGIDMLYGEAELTMGSASPGHYTFRLDGSEGYSSSARFRSLAQRLGTTLANYIVPAGKGAAVGRGDPILARRVDH